MQHLNSIQIHGLVVYEQATFEFSPGTHVVRGENGTGKSLLFTPIANLVYATPPMLSKANQAGKFLTPGSAVTLDWHNRDHHWCITQRTKGRSVGYDIIQDGDALDPKRIGVARERIVEAWPLSAQQFYTFVYLNAFRPNLLLQGSDSDRRAFFEELYVLHRYEQIREALSIEASKIKEGAATHSYLERQLRELRQHRVPSNLARRRHRLEERVVRVGEELTALNRHLQTVAARAALEGSLVLRLGPELTAAKLRKVKRRVAQLQADEERWRSADKTRSLNDSIRERRTRVRRRLKAVGQTRSLHKLEKALDRSKANLSALREQHELWTELRPIVREARQAGKPRHDARTLRKMQAQLEADLERAEGILHKFHRLKGHKACPLCGGRLKSKQVARVIAEQEAVRKAARKTQGLIDTDTARLELADQAARFPADYDPARHQALVDAHRDLVAELKGARERANLEAALAALPKPRANPDENLADPRPALRKAERALTALRRDADTYRQLADQPAADTGNLAVLNAQAERLQRRLERLNSYLFRVTGAASDARANAAQIAKAERDFARYDRQAQLLPVYDALLAAYGARGLKMDHLTHLLRGYEANLNEYAGLIYPKPIRFRVEASASGFRIVAIRNKVESDINLLSGSESRCFTLLSLLSLLPYLPEQYRCNTLILDEMESGMSPRSKAMFCNTFLPHLAQQVECLVLVTPQPPNELYVSGATEYQVTRGRGSNSQMYSELRRL